MKLIVKTALATALLGLLALAGLGAALADTPSPPPATTLHVKGTISAIAMAATPPTVTIHPSEGADVTLKVVDSTVITKAGLGKTTLGELSVGDRVNATYNKDTLEALHLSAAAPLEKHHTFHGTVKSLAADSFVVTTKKHGDVSIKVNAETKYKVPGVKDATLANFHVTDRVNVLAVETSDGDLALHVNLVPGKPISIQRVGTITAYVAGTSITLKDKKGETSTFMIDAETKIEFKRGATEVKVGEQATVVARRDPSTDQYTARAILAFGERGGPKS